MNLQPINPYQIIETLKKENEILKAENEALKKEVIANDTVDTGSDGQDTE